MFTKGQKTRLTHGKRGAPEYYIWLSMKARCDKPSNKHYADYGGRGITYCQRWAKFAHFYADMGDRPSPEHSIERKDTNGNYEPDNCIWATRKVQMRNRRNTRFIEFNGERRSVPEWAEVLGIPYNTLRQRLFRDHLPAEVAFQPAKLLPRIAVGEKTGAAKLTDTQVEEIRARRASGESRKALAAIYGVSTTQIYNIVIGKHRTRGTGLTQSSTEVA